MTVPSPLRVPVAELHGRDVPLGTPERPSWRGRLHVAALVVALPLVVLLAIVADGARARAGVIVYGVGLCAMFAVSSTYHRWVHTRRARAGWRRADHATIFAAIGGTFTAMALTVLHTPSAIVLLVVVWGVSAAGAVLKAAAIAVPDWVSAALYLATGWAGVLIVPALWRSGGAGPVLLLFVGGVAYTIGAIGFGRRWPTLRPATFSYHEVWHVFTVVAAGAHLGAVWAVAA